MSAAARNPSPLGRGGWMAPVSVALAAAGVWFYVVGEPASSPPALPDLRGQPTAMRELLTRYHERAASSPRSAEAHGRYGQALHANQVYGVADVAYGIAAELDPGDFRWPYYRALVAEESARQEEQLRMLEATLELNPRYVPAVLALAELCLRRGELQRAAGLFQRVLDLASGDAVARLHAAIGLARVARTEGDWKAVLSLIEAHARDQGLVREVRQLREEALRKLGDPDAERERELLANRPDLRKAPSVRDPLAEALIDLCCSSTNLMRLANLAEFEGRADLAVRLARRAVEVEPDDADAHHYLAYALIKHVGVEPDVVAEARNHRDRGLGLRSRHVDLLGKLAEAFKERGRPDLAAEEVRRYLEVRPRSADMNLNLGTLLMLQQRFDEAVSYLTLAAELDPASDSARNNLGSALTSLGRLNEALPHLESAVRLNPRNREAQLNLGTVLVRLERPEVALPHLEQAVTLEPRDGQARFRLGATLTRLNRASEALPHLLEAARLHPTIAVVHERLGEALRQVGRVEEAEKHLREADRLSGRTGR